MSDEFTVSAGHYLAGIVGFAMLRDWYGSAESNDARLRELESVVRGRDDFPFSMTLDVQERDLHEGYEEWAATYDGPNPMIDIEERAVRPLLRRLAGPGARALDAACGTGRHAAFLQNLGCETHGVDQSDAMLRIARSKVPAAQFHDAGLDDMPFPDASFDIAVCALALCHLRDPRAAIVELARVLRPGGTLVAADPHPMGGLLGSQAFYGQFGNGAPLRFVRNHRHQASTWIDAFNRAGLIIGECHEPVFDAGSVAASPSSMVFPRATEIAFHDLPCLFVWVVHRPDESPV